MAVAVTVRCVVQEAFRRREEGLRKKDLDLQEALIKLNKFLQESETKRNRALKRAEDEAKAKNQKMKQIEELKETLDRLKREKAAVVAEEKSSRARVLHALLACTLTRYFLPSVFRPSSPLFPCTQLRLILRGQVPAVLIECAELCR